MTLAILTPAAWGQTTTYASPVKVMNTPLPVSGAVTVTPASGTMPVSGSVAVTGTPQVTLSGTPAVTLSGSDNKVQVRPAGTPFAASVMGTLSDGGATPINGFEIMTAPSEGEYTEIEFVAVSCYYATSTPTGLNVSLRTALMDGQVTRFTHYALPITAFTLLQNKERYRAALPVKMYTYPGSSINMIISRVSGAGEGEAACSISISGRSY